MTEWQPGIDAYCEWAYAQSMAYRKACFDYHLASMELYRFNLKKDVQALFDAGKIEDEADGFAYVDDLVDSSLRSGRITEKNILSLIAEKESQNKQKYQN